MPPKKKTDGGGANTTDETIKFSWTPENDRMLLLLCFGRNTSPADYEKFITALPAGANFQGVRQRISKLRVEQRAKYEELGWQLTTEATVKPKASPAATRKRKASSEEDEGGEQKQKSPVKKGRAKKVKSDDEVIEEIIKGEESGDEGDDEGVKSGKDVEEGL